MLFTTFTRQMTPLESTLMSIRNRTEARSLSHHAAGK